MDYFLRPGSFEPCTTDGRLLQGLLNKDVGPIMRQVLRLKLYKCLTEISATTKFADVLDLDLLALGQAWLPVKQVEGLIDSAGVQEPRTNGPFDQLPPEVLFNILSRLDICSLARSSQVSKFFHKATLDPMLYRTVCLKYVFHLVDDSTLRYLLGRARQLHTLGT